MKRKDLLRSLLTPDSVEEERPPATSPADRRVPSGAVRAMGLDLDRLASEARRAEVLERQASNGQLVLELDPSLVDPSFAEDRIARTSDSDYRRLVESIGTSGQQVPILVRPHPDVTGRYQVAYGHRRLAAATELGIPIRALVKPLTDAELVVAQGKENAERRNLTFIERALFAADLEARGFDRPTLLAALAAHPAEMSRYLAVARDVPRWLATAIGAAPKAGRPRWMTLAELLAAEGAKPIIAALVERPDFQASSSDRRFELTIATLRAASNAGPEGASLVFYGPGGEAVIRLEPHATGTRMTVLDQTSPGLSGFLTDRLPTLLAEFYGTVPKGR
jgi:ParB family chromosome partitioning protein